jgi:membrane protease YdiL (CAAX protease family)
MTENLDSPSLIEDREHLPSAPPSRRFPLWSGWDVLFLLSFTGFSAVMLAAVGDAVKHVVRVKLPAIRFAVQPPNEGVYLILLQATLDVLMLLFIYFTITFKYDAPFFRSIKWAPKEQVRAATFLLLGLTLALAVGAAATLFPIPSEPPIGKLLKGAPLAAFLFAALGVFVAPFVEEVIFRGFIYPVIERRFGSILAVVVTALLFSGVHVSQLWGSWPAIVLITLVGLTLSTVRARTDSLFPSFVIHFSYNSTLCFMFLIGVLFEGFPADQ